MSPNEIFHVLFDITTLQSLILRAVIWVIIATVIIVSTDNPNPDKSSLAIKRNVGFLLMFFVLSGTLFYLLFGMTPVVAAQ